VQQFVACAPSTIADRVLKLSDLGFDYVMFQPTPALETLNKMEKHLFASSKLGKYALRARPHTHFDL